MVAIPIIAYRVRGTHCIVVANREVTSVVLALLRMVVLMVNEDGEASNGVHGQTFRAYINTVPVDVEWPYRE